MPVLPFVNICPKIGRLETRAVQITGDARIPDGKYTFFDCYCDNPYCDCRYAVIEVESEFSAPDAVAVLKFGWESQEYYAGRIEHEAETYVGVHVDFDNKQSKYAKDLRDVFEEYVTGHPDYVTLLRSHYDLVKATVGLGATQNKRFLQKRRSQKKKQNKR